MMWFDNRLVRPAVSGRYLVYKKSNEHEVLNYSVKHQAWNLYDDHESNWDKEIEVSCWTFLDDEKAILRKMVGRGN